MSEPLMVWLDDQRPAPDGFDRARTTDEVIEMLETGNVIILDLDYNLGPETAKGGRVLDWILARLEEDPEWPVPDIKIHASRSNGRDMMLRKKQEIDEKTSVRAREKRKRA